MSGLTAVESAKAYNGNIVDRKTFGKRLRQQRTNAKLSQRELGQLIHLSTTTIQQYEKGTLPKGGHLAMLARCLGCTADWLLFGETTGDENCGPSPSIKNQHNTGPYRINADYVLPSFSEGFDRVSKATGIQSNIDLANMLEISGPAVADAKRRNAFPVNWMITISWVYGTSLEYLLTGRAGLRWLVDVDPRMPIEILLRQLDRLAAQRGGYPETICLSCGRFQNLPAFGAWASARNVGLDFTPLQDPVLPSPFMG